ncbi:Aldo/keto reductase [Myriangium duriaei CBS 260.36]|uniref:Aldo/keto reductase n=1 Tax=Myriangium duriaei CBS 260.36 TaxID=1168546 RepID=A0A9P4MEV2_9PEZI|nr:Aldo/keto reductase [Myriangium duriaei CBS 260.36]
MTVAPTVKLNTGLQMPLVGFGLWKVNNDTCADQVYNAIKTGYRLFDGACDYGNEVEAGQGVARAIKDGLVKREELFLVSKLWNSFHDKERVKPIAKKQLKDWGIDYFDLYFVHFPIALKYVDPSVRYPPGWSDENDKVSPSKTPLSDTWKAMEELVDEGLAKNIGISNYNGALVLDLLRYARITPATLQIEHHPYLTQEGLLQLCKDNNIHVTAYSSFGPQSFVELDMQKAKDTPLLFDHKTVKTIADKHQKSPAQVLLRWATQRGVAVIPKSNNQNRLAQNLDVCSFDLSNDEIKSISSLNQNLRFNDPPGYGVAQPIFA